MDCVATLVAPAALDPRAVAPLVDRLAATHVERLGERAADIYFSGQPDQAKAAIGAPDAFDAIVQPVAARRKQLVLCDMDSTLINEECIDELAAALGIGEEIAAITAATMRGDLDFVQSVTARVARLEGTPVATIDTLLATRISAAPGAGTFAATLAAEGIALVLVSGGFTAFADPVAKWLGIPVAYANTLEVVDGVLTGRLVPPVLGPDAKRERLAAECAARDVSTNEAAAVGDGANDLAMIAAAGLGIAVHAKPAVQAAADAAVRVTDLSALLYAFGIAPNRFVVRDLCGAHPNRA